MNEKTKVQEMLHRCDSPIEVGEYWTHYKGGVYQIVAKAVKEDTLEPLVVYKSLKHATIWVRTWENWFEDVHLPTGKVKRFIKGAP